MRAFILLFAGFHLSMGQESTQLRLTVVEKSVTTNTNKLITLHLKAVNLTNKNLRLFCFYDEWKDFVDEADSLPKYVMPGFSLEIFNSKGEKDFPVPYSIVTKEMFLETINAESVDSLVASIKRKYGDVENWESEEKKRILASEKVLPPKASIETVLNISFQGFLLEKGKYELVIYYVINDMLYDYVEKREDIFMGWTKSNKIQLIVE
jgi:hypothetical protein